MLYLNAEYLVFHSMFEIILTAFWHFISSITFFMFFYNFNYVNSITFSTLSALLAMYFIKIRQVYLVLNKIMCKKFTTSNYDKYRQYYWQSFAFFMTVRKSYCSLFLTTLFVSVPNNIIMSLWICLGEVSKGNNLFIR